MSKIMEKAEKLATAIVETEEYSNMLKAEREIDSDNDAAKLVKKIEDLQMQIDKNKENDELKEKMGHLQQKMWGNPKIKSFMQKQQKFNKLMTEVNKKLKQGLFSESS